MARHLIFYLCEQNGNNRSLTYILSFFLNHTFLKVNDYEKLVLVAVFMFVCGGSFLVKTKGFAIQFSKSDSSRIIKEKKGLTLKYSMVSNGSLLCLTRNDLNKRN